MITDQPTEPLDLDAVRERADAAKAAADVTRFVGPADLVAHGLKAAASVADVPDLIAEVKELREDLADLAQARAVIAATRQMAIDANARLRAQLLEALGREDDGRAPLSAHVAHLAAQRDALKASLSKADAEVAVLHAITNKAIYYVNCDHEEANTGAPWDALVHAVRVHERGSGA